MALSASIGEQLASKNIDLADFLNKMREAASSSSTAVPQSITNTALQNIPEIGGRAAGTSIAEIPAMGEIGGILGKSALKGLGTVGGVAASHLADPPQANPSQTDPWNYTALKKDDKGAYGTIPFQSPMPYNIGDAYMYNDQLSSKNPVLQEFEKRYGDKKKSDKMGNDDVLKRSTVDEMVAGDAQKKRFLHGLLGLPQDESDVPISFVNKESEEIDDDTSEDDGTGDSSPLRSYGHSLKTNQSNPIADNMNAVAEDTINTRRDLASAQQRFNDSALTNQLGAAAAKIGAGIAGLGSGQIKPFEADTSGFKENIGMADKQLSQFKDLQNKEIDDPNSGVSKNYRALAKQMFGIDLSPNVSGANILKTMPTLASVQNTKEKAEANRLAKSEQRSDKERLQGNLLTTRVVRDVVQGGGPAMNMVRNRLNRADNVFATAQVDPRITPEQIDKLPPAQLNKIPRPQIVELGIEMNALLGGSSSPAQRTLDKLIPNNANMDTTKVMDYITNNLNPAEQAQAVKSYLKIAARGRDISLNKVKSHIKQVLAGNQFLLKDPERRANFEDQIRASGFDPDEVLDFKATGKSDTKQAPSNRPSVSRATVGEYAKKHGISEDQATQLLSQKYDIK